MIKEVKRTFTYSGKPSLKDKATRKAKKEGRSFSEKIDQLLEEYLKPSNGIIYAVYAIDWIEYERGWGQRPDGTSLHKSLDVAKKYIEETWSRRPDGEAPECYSKPGDPYLKEVSKELWNKVQEKKSTWQ